ncbi:MAG: hypothetical protein HFG80_05015 [Eubacterium sp.]|nr:hypothetical protein [Eubacterium sp.]
MKPLKPVAILLLTLSLIFTSVPPQAVFANTGNPPGSPTGNTVLTPDSTNNTDHANRTILTPDETASLSAVGAEEEPAPDLELPSKATAYVKVPYQLTATPEPTAKVTWTTGNSKIATVENGTVTGKKTGTVTITASANGITKKCKVTVKKPSVSLNIKQTSLYKGSTLIIHASVRPEYAAVKWKSSKPGVASVDKDGIVTAKKTGKTTITATVGNAKASCTITVQDSSCKLNITNRTIMAGTDVSLYIKNAPTGIYPFFTNTTGSSCVSLHRKGNTCTIKGLKKGTAKISVSFSTFKDGRYISWSNTCTIKVVDTGISDQQFSLAKGTSKTLSVKKDGQKLSVKNTRWKSSAPKIASVNNSGTVTAKKIGTATISAEVTFADGQTATYKCTAKVSDPAFKTRTVVSAVGVRKKLSVKNTNSYSRIKWGSSRKSVVSVDSDGTIKGRKKGTATIKAVADGKTIRCKVYVSNPKLKTRHAMISSGGRKTISVKGLAKKSKVTYKSSNSAIASVSKKGVIRGKTHGKATITVNADGKKFSYVVEVVPAEAINATRVGKAIMYSSSYSQARRMTAGYYDCSSLVFRAYGCNTSLLGGTPSWAPTAASMALHLERTGKAISYGYIDVSHLQPGDLIFYGNSGNGRYKGIYHVSMYYGKGLRLEKPFRAYYNTGNIVMIARPIL